MATSDYKCKECENIIEYVKEYGVDFPKEVECPSCGGTMEMYFGTKRVVTSVADGMINGVYKGGKFTPQSVLKKHKDFEF